MPSVSPAQHRLMEAAAHTPGGYDGVPQSVGKEFVKNDSDGTVKAAGIMFLAPGKQVLFLKRGPGSDYPGLWSLPGGRLEPGETAAEAAIREVAEETGFKADGLKFWTRRIAQHETTGAQPSPMNGQPVAAPVSPVVLPPGDALVLPGEPVDFTTFLVKMDEPFTPTMNDENVGWAWAPADQPPEPVHPGCRIALQRLDMDELGIARAMVAGDLTSPQRYENVSLFDIRITGTGAAYRTEFKEYVWREPSEYLNDDFLARCNGLSVLFMHPEKKLLDSEEFADRIVGAVMLPYIKGNEVWGIARIYDDAVIELMENQQMSTSPGVLFRDPESTTKISLEDGSKVLVELKPDLLDHVAICAQGVWDKGEPPTGIITDNLGDTTMTEEEMKAKADAEAKAKADADAGEKLDKILKFADACGTMLDSVGKRLDALEKAKADAEMTAEEKEKAEKEAKAKADAEAKEKADAEAKAKADAEEKEKDEIKKRLDAMEGNMPTAMSDAEKNELGEEQAKADSVAAMFGKSAPAPMPSERPTAYRRRVVSQFKAHSPNWKDVDLSSVSDDVLSVAAMQIYADAQVAARHPSDLPDNELRMISTRLPAGHTENKFIGRPSAWMSRFAHNKAFVSGNIRTRFD